MITVRSMNFSKNLVRKAWNFPAGEFGVEMAPPCQTGDVLIALNYESDKDFVELLHCVNALKHLGCSSQRMHLLIPYFPYSRQDRVTSKGGSFGLQVAVDLIKLTGIEHIETYDAHSDVLGGMFPPGVLKNWTMDTLLDTHHFNIIRSASALVSPDAGASKKIYKISKALNKPFIEASKHRDAVTGQVSGVRVDIPAELLNNEAAHLVVLDDICDGGATFINLAVAIRELGFTGKLSLITTHGIYSKGIDALYEHYTNVECVNRGGNFG